MTCFTGECYPELLDCIPPAKLGVGFVAKRGSNHSQRQLSVSAAAAALQLPAKKKKRQAATIDLIYVA